MLCDYNCGNLAIKKNKSGRWMCCESANSCPANKLKNSNALKQSGRDWKKIASQMTDDAKSRQAWSKGLTKHEHAGIAKMAKTLTGKRKITDQVKLQKRIYWEQCQFDLSNVIHKVLGFQLLEQHGMYHKVKNKGGVVRDHRISIDYGFKNKISPDIIKHPANCRFVPVYANSGKSTKCEISLQQLVEEINTWNNTMLP